MRRWQLYVERAVEILRAFEGNTPLAPVLKEYFRQHRQMGATDRRFVSDLVYCFYRLGYAFRELETSDRLLLGYFLCRQESSPLLEALRPGWVSASGQLPEEKLSMVLGLDAQAGSGEIQATAPGAPGAELAHIFPWKDRLSAGVDPRQLALSHLRQPDVYIRLRPGYGAQIRKAFAQANIVFTETDGTADALQVATGTALQDLFPPDKAFVIQDLSSQRIGTLAGRAFQKMGNAEPAIWDCCAASGGKAIMLKDILPSARLTVSDIRSSILHNLDRRFEAAGIRYERAFTADLSKPGKGDHLRANSFDFILADVPCSGSGTWSRTPEQLYFFEEDTIAEFARLQKDIASKAAETLKPGGFFLYATCSVFAEENEQNVAYLADRGLELIEQKIFEGYTQRADTLFGALLRKAG